MNGQDIRSNATAPYVAEIRDAEDSMECGEEMAEDTYTTMECQPYIKNYPKRGMPRQHGTSRIKKERDRKKAVMEEIGFECNRKRRDRPGPH